MTFKSATGFGEERGGWESSGVGADWGPILSSSHQASCKPVIIVLFFLLSALLSLSDILAFGLGKS